MPNGSKRNLKRERRERIIDRVVLLVDDRFEGNLTAAAKTIGCRYDPLRNIYLGIAVRPALDVLLAIASYDEEKHPSTYWLGD